MNYWKSLIHTVSLATFFCCVVSLFDGVAFGATTPPVVTVLPIINEGSVTPTRMTQDLMTGNIYVTDPHAEGIMVYNTLGQLVKQITTAKEAGGIAIAKNGDLLVTQGTYVAVIDPNTGLQKSTFGTFTYAFAIAVDNTDSISPARVSTGKIFVSDVQGYSVQVFDSSYAPVDVTAGTAYYPGNPINYIGVSYKVYNGNVTVSFNRPAGVAIERNSGRLAVVDSLAGAIKFFDQAGNVAGQFGAVGYDPARQFIMVTYPQAIAFEYTPAGVLDRAYVLDTFQSYVMVLDATAPFPTVIDPYLTTTIPWTWLADIGQYGHRNGDLIVPTDILIDKKDPANNRLIVSNGFGSLSVFGLGSLQPYNVTVNNATTTSLRVNWSNTSGAYDNIRVYRSTVAGQLGTNVSGNLAKGTTTFTDTGLTQYTTYYYTVRAVVLPNTETNNVSQVSGKTTGLFNLSVSVVGNGQVNGSVSCPSGTCVSSQLSDTLITLTATASGQSVFDGWTGDCFTTAATCIVSMNSAKLVTASFSAKQAFRVDGAYFDNLQDAYREARDGSVIKVLAGTWPSTTQSTEYMTAWQAKTVTIEGGYDPTFTTNAGGTSTIVGRINLNAGKVVTKQLRLQ